MVNILVKVPSQEIHKYSLYRQRNSQLNFLVITTHRHQHNANGLVPNLCKILLVALVITTHFYSLHSYVRTLNSLTR